MGASGGYAMSKQSEEWTGVRPCLADDLIHLCHQLRFVCRLNADWRDVVAAVQGCPLFIIIFCNQMSK